MNFSDLMQPQEVVHREGTNLPGRGTGHIGKLPPIPSHNVRKHHHPDL
jgi:hypothetical protein